MKRITLTFNNEKTVSDIFNFKAYRIMSDILTDKLTTDKLDDAAMQGLIAMFDGTELTSDALLSGWRNFDEKELTEALDNIVNWFISTKPPKDKQAVGEQPPDPIMSLYNSLLTHHLPSEIDKQDPQLLIDVMNAEKSGVTSVENVPDNLKIYYGL